MPASKTGKYEIGYGRPPKSCRWKKGQSGNSRGRPKGTKNLYTDLAEELAESIAVNEGGNQKKLSKQRAMIKQIVNKALKGDVAATRTVITMVASIIMEKDRENEEVVLSGFDNEILENFIKRNQMANGRKK